MRMRSLSAYMLRINIWSWIVQEKSFISFLNYGMSHRTDFCNTVLWALR